MDCAEMDNDFNLGYIAGKVQYAINQHLIISDYKVYLDINIWAKHKKIRVYLKLTYPDKEVNIGYISFESGIKPFIVLDYLTSFETRIFNLYVKVIRSEYGIISDETRENVKKVTRRKKEIKKSKNLIDYEGD